MEMDDETEGEAESIKRSPLILMDPTKPVSSEKKFKYALHMCPKHPNKSGAQRKLLKSKTGATTNSGMPLFSTHQIRKHYLSTEQWERAT
mmetsp:Transcript_6224/g.10132  ORF Transcript_6224/g.10132 Transcript_6224/m.10132 type:complete len:90 (-) Transcript_6224:1858-2127(-)